VDPTAWYKCTEKDIVIIAIVYIANSLSDIDLPSCALFCTDLFCTVQSVQNNYNAQHGSAGQW